MRISSRRVGALFASGALVATACAEPAPARTARVVPPGGRPGAASGTEAERFFPLVDGNVYQYATLRDAEETGLLVARVFRADDAHGELRFASGAKRFEYAPDGVRLAGGLAGGAYLLKSPLAVGGSWTGEHGGQTRVVAVDARIDVPAGSFAGCIQTIETRGGDRPAQYATTFCPGTGVVALEVAGRGGAERAELKSYGAPIDIGPDGLRRVP